MKAIVYLDVLFLINFIINMVILKVTSVFIKADTKVFRLCVASCIGSIYAIGMFLPKISFLYIFPFKLLVSLIMIVISQKEFAPIKLIKSCAVFYLTSFSFAGIMLCLVYFTAFSDTAYPIIKNGIFYFDISLTTLIITSGIVYFLLRLSSRVFSRNKSLGIKKLRIILGERECIMSALSDTGNLLKDPISSYPVIIADKKSVMPLFPSGVPDAQSLVTGGANLRVIPYSSIGAKNEIMTGFIPDMIEIDGKVKKDVVIGISENTICDTDEYNALINPNILN